MTVDCIIIGMIFSSKLTKINRFLILFGISPSSYNEKLNKFECSVCTLSYTLAYFLVISIAIIYMSFVYHLKNGELFRTTFSILTFLQYATVMTIFYATIIDLMMKRKMFSNFLNNLVKLDTNLAKLNINTNSADLSSLHKQHIFIVFFYAFVYLTKSIIYANRFKIFEHVWNALNYFQTISLTMVGYYIRSFAIILTRRCKAVLEYLDVIRNDLFHSNDNQESIVELLKCLESFDEIMILKNDLSTIFGLQLLLNSAFDFIMLTISVYGMTYFIKDIENLYYFAAFNLPHAIKCILVVLALDTLADQVRYF